jgi:hypothetical protein
LRELLLDSSAMVGEAVVAAAGESAEVVAAVDACVSYAVACLVPGL